MVSNWNAAVSLWILHYKQCKTVIGEMLWSTRGSSEDAFFYVECLLLQPLFTAEFFFLSMQETNESKWLHLNPLFARSDEYFLLSTRKSLNGQLLKYPFSITQQRCLLLNSRDGLIQNLTNTRWVLVLNIKVNLCMNCSFVYIVIHLWTHGFCQKLLQSTFM